ncbi:MAG TPA: Hsp20/alpha crystallin family protein [Candidatus Binatia bacterium]
MAEQTVATTSRQETSMTPKETTHSRERTLTPPVDIYETPDGLVVLADLPGVSKEGLDVRVENDILTIRGTSSDGLPGEPIYREFELANYFRQFELSEKVDQNKITAELKHGVLTLKLPKAEEAKPKKIEVKVN